MDAPGRSCRQKAKVIRGRGKYIPPGQIASHYRRIRPSPASDTPTPHSATPRPASHCPIPKPAVQNPTPKPATQCPILEPASISQMSSSSSHSLNPSPASHSRMSTSTSHTLTTTPAPHSLPSAHRTPRLIAMAPSRIDPQPSVEADDHISEDLHGEEDDQSEPLRRPELVDVPVSYRRDDQGRVIISPQGNGWEPPEIAIAAVGHAIKSQFRGAWHHYDVVPNEDQTKWWQEFQSKVSWDPTHQAKIEVVYTKKIKKRLNDMLGKLRRSGKKPHWIGEEAWAGLLEYWNTDDFKQMSARNKQNRASTRGGALHTTGRRSHIKVARLLENRLGRAPTVAELFTATRMKKSGEWVDTRSRDTYSNFKNLVESQVSVTGPSVDLQAAWVKVAGRTKGRCYGTADLAPNARPGASTLLCDSQAPPASSSVVEEVVQRAAIAEERAAAAEERAAAAEERAAAVQAEMQQRAAAAEERAARVEAEMQERAARVESEMQQMREMWRAMLDQRSGAGSARGSASVSQPHPDYDPRLDEEPLGQHANVPVQKRARR